MISSPKNLQVQNEDAKVQKLNSDRISEKSGMNSSIAMSNQLKNFDDFDDLASESV